LDGVNAATGILQYVNAGYYGEIAGGLAPWAHITNGVGRSPTLGLVIRDGCCYVYHPAFYWLGENRIRYHINLYGTVVDVNTTTTIPDPDDPHGTNVTAIAMANSFAGQDTRLTTTEEKSARSGIVRLGAAVFTKYALADGVLDILLAEEFGKDPNNNPANGVDVFTSSVCGNSGARIPNTDYKCPTEEEARGIDSVSLDCVSAFYYDGVVFVKSAGNLATENLTSCSTSSQVSSPGASPAVLAVGALESQTLAPSEMQEATALNSQSSGGYTPDGRVYPALTVSSYQCGTATIPEPVIHLPVKGVHPVPKPIIHPLNGPAGYGKMGATSGAAPRIAGAAVLFKNWDLQQYGSIANTPGRTVVNILNFADGYTEEDNSGAGVRVNPPSPWWGLGRFKMRLISDEGLGGTGYWGTTQVCVSTGDVKIVNLAENADGGVIPSTVRRLRITAWWLEVNNDVGQSKASIAMHLLGVTSSNGVSVSSGWIDSVETSTDRVLRLQYECGDTWFSDPPSGEIYLVIVGQDVPKDEFVPNRQCCRTIYIAWFWETGSDQSNISCTAVKAGCKNVIGVPGGWNSLQGGINTDLSELLGQVENNLRANVIGRKYG
jgi:hypothetical protein